MITVKKDAFEMVIGLILRLQVECCCAADTEYWALTPESRGVGETQSTGRI